MVRRTASVVILATLLVIPACSSSEEPTPWASEAEDVVELLADAYDTADYYETARFFTAGGTLDLNVWDLGVATTPDEVVEAVRKLWFIADYADVRANHLFVSPDAALVWWSAYDEGGGSDWIQTYLFGTAGQTASVAFRSPAGLDQEATPEELTAIEVARQYVAAWEGRDVTALGRIYARAAVILDQTTGREWRSASDLIAEIGLFPPLQAGPSPGIFLYHDGEDVQVLVLVQLGGECPRLEARRLVLSGDTITRETRYTHVPSAQRCLAGLGDGWWTTFELPPDLESNVTEIVDVGGLRVELINAEPIHEEFTRWMFDRYIESGIGIPEAVAIWFPPAPECDELGGLAIETDARYADRRTVVICFAADRLEWDDSASGWFPIAASYGLHELAHIWMLDNLTDDTRDDYNEMAGLTVWRGAETAWANRGVEQAAFTIPWAITEWTDVVWPISFPGATCEHLSYRYQLLTGHQPLRECEAQGSA